VSELAKFVVERQGGGDQSFVWLHLNTGSIIRISEDTAQILARALQMVAFGEKPRLTVYEETETRPAGMYS